MEEQDHHGYTPLPINSNADSESALTSGGLAGARAPELIRLLQPQQQINQEFLSVLSSLGSASSRPDLVSVPSPAPTVIYASEDQASSDLLRDWPAGVNPSALV